MATSTDRKETSTPVMRLLGMLEIIAENDRPLTPPELIELSGLPKPTVHRMLQQLESTGMLHRDGDNRHYSAGLRLRYLAENLLMNSTVHGGRHAVLSELVAEIGESCNITALSGNQVLYLDRMETAAPLRFYLHPGSRVPVHCSASGKLFLAQMNDEQQARLLDHSTLQRCTPNTFTSLEALVPELARIRDQGYALDNEEFLPDLQCIAVPVPGPGKRTNLALAVQAPMTRFDRDRAISLLPTLHKAAAALAGVDTGPDQLASRATGGAATVSNSQGNQSQFEHYP